MTISLDVLGTTAATILTFSFYSIFLKLYPKKMILLFWVEIITYLCFAGLFLFYQIVLEHDMSAFEELIYDYTYTNLPMYALMAMCFVGFLLVLNYLLDHFDVSLITPLTQISLLFTVVGYFALGEQFSYIVLASVLVIFLGAILSSLKKFSWPNPFIEFKNISMSLIAFTVIYALLVTATNLVTHQVTRITPQTLSIIHWIKYAIKSFHVFPFRFYNPFFFNLGVRFFIMIFFIITFFITEEKHIKAPFIAIKKDFWFILKTSLCYFIFSYTYYYSYMHISNANILEALNKLTIPTILVMGNLMLGEKITAPRVVGSIVIFLGGVIILFI